MLGVTSLCYVLMWGTGLRRGPRLRRLRYRHLGRLAVGGALHAVATVLTLTSVMVGPVSSSGILKTTQPLVDVFFVPTTTAGTPWMALASILVGVVLSLDSLPQAFAGLAASVCFVARSHLRFQPKRYGGPANLYGLMTCISFLLMVPVTIMVEGKQGAILSMGGSSSLSLFLFGLSNFVLGEWTLKMYARTSGSVATTLRRRLARPSETQVTLDTIRRVLTCILSAHWFHETTIPFHGAVLAFGGFWVVTTEQSLDCVVGVPSRRRSESDSSLGSMRSESTLTTKHNASLSIATKSTSRSSTR